ncbi:hypothetical protein HRG_003252 [Hirsutella rhossiliensis]|uniref:Uncharacterized protein n=1 Tax=Hirsutella rhossiliensis TaxID=111463 RepID=A0A9P8SJT1_9HYPO|nr:uncharacterized protein HRG_03252 [Hirsutella rhossiliensis]KAH0965236.1 hypothetical protein HRG_03252 [Hirsutella rhossiliensis]
MCHSTDVYIECAACAALIFVHICRLELCDNAKEKTNPRVGQCDNGVAFGWVTEENPEGRICPACEADAAQMDSIEEQLRQVGEGRR